MKAQDWATRAFIPPFAHHPPDTLLLPLKRHSCSHGSTCPFLHVVHHGAVLTMYLDIRLGEESGDDDDDMLLSFAIVIFPTDSSPCPSFTQ